MWALPAPAKKNKNKLMLHVMGMGTWVPQQKSKWKTFGVIQPVCWVRVEITWVRWRMFAPRRRYYDDNTRINIVPEPRVVFVNWWVASGAADGHRMSDWTKSSCRISVFFFIFVWHSGHELIWTIKKVDSISQYWPSRLILDVIPCLLLSHAIHILRMIDV